MDRPHYRHFQERSWGFRTFRAYSPPPLPPKPALDYSGALPRLIGEAAHALGLLGSISANPDAGSLIGLQFIRREAVLSSQIEGAQSSVADSLLVPHLGGSGEFRDEDAEIENCVDATYAGLKALADGAAIDAVLMRRLHGILLRGEGGCGKKPGQFRTRQN